MDFVAFMCAPSLTITFAGLDVGLLKKDAWKANWCRYAKYVVIACSQKLCHRPEAVTRCG